jgi:predicted RNA-binding protein Jag
MHGQNLQAINHLLSRMIEKITGGFSIIHLEVNDYMKEKDDRFFRYLDGRIDFAMKSRTNVAIPNLNAYERKKAHSHIADKKIEGLRTYSQGEGKERMLHLIYEGPEIASHTPAQSSTPRKTEIDISEDGIGI